MCERKPDIRSLSSSFSNCAPNHTTSNLSPNLSNKQGSSKTATNDLADQGRNSPVASTSTRIVEYTTVDRGCSRSKKARNDFAELQERNRVASTSTQLHPENGIILKHEIEEGDVEVENDEVAQRRIDVSCSITSVAALKSTTGVRRSKRRRNSSNESTSEVSKQPTLSRKVPKKYKKFSEGCLVMGRIYDYPWPGMIRKAGEDDHDQPDCISYYSHSITRFCVQLFKDPTTLHWLQPCSLRIFDASKPNRGNHRDPKDVVAFKKGIQIAKAALNYSVDARLEKFTLPSGAAIDDLLTEMDTDNFLTQQPHPPVSQNNLLVHDRNAAAAITRENGVSSPDLVTQHDEESTLPSNENGEISHESVEIVMTRRLSEYQQKLRDECNREKDEIIRRLERDKAELEAIVEEKEKTIVDLSEAFDEKNLKHRKEMEDNNQKHRMEMEKVNLKYKNEMDKQKQEKRKLHHELETRKAVFDKMFPESKT